MAKQACQYDFVLAIVGVYRIRLVDTITEAFINYKNKLKMVLRERAASLKKGGSRLCLETTTSFGSATANSSLLHVTRRVLKAK
jgi:hypothetical protein